MSPKSFLSSIILFIHLLSDVTTSYRIMRMKHGVTTMSVGSVPTSIASKEKVLFDRVAKSLIVGHLPFIFNLKKSNAVSDTIFPECSESVTVLRRGSSEAVVIGTAHISEESAQLVKRTIQTLTPNTVMIELDPKRIGKFSNMTALSSAGFDVPTFSSSTSTQSTTPSLKPRQPNLFIDIVNSIKNVFGGAVQSISGAVLGQILSQFYKSVEKLGFTAGGEFKTAVNEGRKLGARILLGDRDVDITLQRLSIALSAYSNDNFEKLLTRLQNIEAFETSSSISPDSLQGGAQLDKERLSSFVESLKERSALRLMAATLKEEVPLVYEALIGERDQYMAHSIAEVNTNNNNMLVGVVGMMHLDGIEKSLINNYGYTVVRTTCPKLQNKLVNSEEMSPSATFHIPIIS